MKYSFDEVINRRGTDSMKWNVGENELPMWVADMDFQTAPPIIEALQKRVAHGVFGYTEVPEEWYKAYRRHWSQVHQIELEEEWMMFCTGVVPAISSIVRKLTTPNENVVLLTPTYNIFFNSTVNNGCRVLECPLSYKENQETKEYEYQIDFEALEKALSDPQTSLLIFCNPHNPVGKIWEKDTLIRVGELCKKYGVIVISDEIHCDIVRPGMGYVPFAAASEVCREISITCIAPTKTFNIAGLNSAAIVVPNPLLRHKVWRGINTDEVAEPNCFACDVAIAAFNECEEWRMELNEYLFQNREFATRYIQENIPEISVVRGDATYLLWINACKIEEDAEKLAEFIRRRTGLYIVPGAEYGEAGKSFLRINLACARSVVEDGMRRLLVGVQEYRNTKN